MEKEITNYSSCRSKLIRTNLNNEIQNLKKHLLNLIIKPICDNRRFLPVVGIGLSSQFTLK